MIAEALGVPITELSEMKLVNAAVARGEHARDGRIEYEPYAWSQGA